MESGRAIILRLLLNGLRILTPLTALSLSYIENGVLWWSA